MARPKPSPPAPDLNLTAIAAQDAEVRAAVRALAMASIAKAHMLLEHGTPDRQDRMISLIAGPIIKDTLAPSNDPADADFSQKFHALRQSMMSGVQPELRVTDDQ